MPLEPRVLPFHALVALHHDLTLALVHRIVIFSCFLAAAFFEFFVLKLSCLGDVRLIPSDACLSAKPLLVLSVLVVHLLPDRLCEPVEVDLKAHEVADDKDKLY